MDKVQIFIKNNIRIIVSDLTKSAQKNIEVQKCNPFPALVLAKAISVFGPLSSILSIKSGKVTTFIKSENGTIKNLIVESRTDGSLRALLDNNDIVTEKDDSDFENIPLVLGLGNDGFLRITRNNGSQHFGGEVKLMKSDIVTDLAYYFKVSEQIYTAIISSVKFKNKQTLERVYSVIFQLLPSHTEEDIVWIENFLKNNNLDNMSLEEYIDSMEATFLQEKQYFWECKFNKEEVLSSLKLIEKTEIDKILNEDGKIEVECHFCKENFYFYREDFK
ncbi:Hsp33 family molecular chaperone HslO [Mycoplasma sp. AC157]|uniref:Hsp33 family molecular chaperone HslO n=1 Tax=Mycoplasma sp. 480 TaxID=3440155 RepID=UPI003F5176D7